MSAVSASVPRVSTSDPSADWLALAEQHRPTNPGVARLLGAWRDATVRLEQLTLSAEAGAPLSPDELRRAAERAGYELRRALVPLAPAAAWLCAEAEHTAAGPTDRRRGWRQCVLAQVLSRLGDGDAALELATSAFALGQAQGDQLLVLAATIERSRLLAQLGEVGRTAVLLQDGIVLARQLKDRASEGFLVASLGFLHATQDEPEPYEKYTREALVIFREVGDQEREAHALANLGGALARMKRLDEAEALYRDGTALATGLGNSKTESLLLSGLGALCCARGDFEQGVALYRRSELLLEALQDHFQIARHALLLGRHFVEASRYAEAAPHLERAIALAAARGFRGNVAEARELLSRVLERSGDFAGAMRQLRGHLALREELVESRIAERVHAVELRYRAESASTAMESANRRATDLEAANTELRAALEREQELKLALDRLARTDALTGLANRRQLQEFLAQEVGRSRRRWRPMALAMVDVDHFKAINDTHGHAVGDEVLVELGRRLTRTVRTVDVVARCGGEEFCVCLLETEGAMALEVAQRLLDAVGCEPFLTSRGPLRVTASLGVADLRQRDDSVERLAARADAALYDAKRRGRNRVERELEEPLALELDVAE